MDPFVYPLFISFVYFIQLAGIALAQEMSLTGRSTHLLYYMAVQHYLLRRYDDALSHLKEARRQYGMVRHCIHSSYKIRLSYFVNFFPLRIIR